MRYSTTTGLVMAAITVGEVMAGPTHAHMHKHMREKKDVDWNALDWNAMGIDWSSAWAAGQKTAAPAPVATQPAAPAVVAPAPVATTPAAPASPVEAPSSGPAIQYQQDSSSAQLYNGVKGVSNERTEFGGRTAASGALGDHYRGNVGKPYGSNVIKVSSAEGYQYTITFVNTQSKAITVNIWNKIGEDGQDLSGSALAPKKTTLTFVLSPGAQQVVALDENSQVAWAEPCEKISISGAYATTWGEANFVSTGSGYDVSAIMSGGNSYNMRITSQEAAHCTSDMHQNMWLTETAPIGDSNGSCFIAQSHATLKVEMGGQV